MQLRMQLMVQLGGPVREAREPTFTKISGEHRHPYHVRVISISSHPSMSLTGQPQSFALVAVVYVALAHLSWLLSTCGWILLAHLSRSAHLS